MEGFGLRWKMRMRSDGEGNGRIEKIEKEGKPEGSRFEYCCYVLITSRTWLFVSTPILFFALFAFVTLLLMYATGSSQCSILASSR